MECLQGVTEGGEFEMVRHKHFVKHYEFQLPILVFV